MYFHFFIIFAYKMSYIQFLILYLCQVFNDCSVFRKTIKNKKIFFYMKFGYYIRIWTDQVILSFCWHSVKLFCFIAPSISFYYFFLHFVSLFLFLIFSHFKPHWLRVIIATHIHKKKHEIFFFHAQLKKKQVFSNSF